MTRVDMVIIGIMIMTGARIYFKKKSLIITSKKKPNLNFVNYLLITDPLDWFGLIEECSQRSKAKNL